jgi:hypothetical protein
VTSSLHVAARVAGLCLDPSGHLPANHYLDMGVRGGLLVDLARAQRLTQTDESIELDPSPVGWPPADQALDELGVLDGRSLDWWLEHSPFGLADAAAALVADGTWAPVQPHGLRLKARYAVRETAALEHDRALLTRPEVAADGDDAAVVAIAAAAGLAKGQAAAALSPDELLVGMAALTWVGRLVTEFISSARIEGTAVSGASQTALWSGIPY